VGLVYIFFPGYFIKLFINEPDVLSSGIECLRIVSLGFIAYGFGMVVSNSFNGAGDTGTPLKVNFVAYWLIEIPLAWLLAMKAGMNENGVFWSIVIAESFMTLTAFLIFRRGKWKLKEV